MLTVSSFKWKDVREAYVTESMVRNVKWLLEKHPGMGEEEGRGQRVLKAEGEAEAGGWRQQEAGARWEAGGDGRLEGEACEVGGRLEAGGWSRRWLA